MYGEGSFCVARIDPDTGIYGVGFLARRFAAGVGAAAHSGNTKLCAALEAANQPAAAAALRGDRFP